MNSKSGNTFVRVSLTNPQLVRKGRKNSKRSENIVKGWNLRIVTNPDFFRRWKESAEIVRFVNDPVLHRI
jgi:hypothetical protein